MEKNFKQALTFVLKSEGGFVNDPHDTGGATNKGITLGVFQLYKGKDKTVDNLKNISDKDVEDIYKSMYWDVARCNELPTGLDYAMFDTAVNSGAGRATKLLQMTCGVIPDGVIGPATLKAVLQTENVAEEFLKRRMSFLRSLSNFNYFGKGWTKRVNDVKANLSAFKD